MHSTENRSGKNYMICARKCSSVSGSFIAYDVAIGNPEIWGIIKPDSEQVKDIFLGIPLAIYMPGDFFCKNF